MAGKFELYTDKGGKFRYRLKASNGQIILVGQAYATKASLENGIESIKTNAPLDERYERKEATNGKPMFTLKAANHQVIGNSEQYESVSARENGIESVKKNAPDAKVDDQI